MYKTNFKKSWLDLKNNIILLLPDLIYVLFIMALGYVILDLSGMYDFFKDLPSLLGPEDVDDVLFFITSNISGIIISGLIFLVLALFVGIGATSAKLGMIKDVMSKKKTNIKNGLNYINKFYWKVFGIKILTFLIYLGVIFSALVLYFILNSLQLGIIASILSIIFFAIVIIIVILSLLFKYPILFSKNRNSKESISLSYKFFKENKSYNLVILCMIILTALVTSIIFDILALIPFIGRIIESLSSLSTLIIRVWANIFLFNSYLKR